MIALYPLVGFLIGIFLNYCADQLPRWRSLRRAPFCPHCDQPRPIWAWVGTLAYLRFKPDCAHCGAPISWRHPIVEVGTALLYAFLWYTYALPGEWVVLVLYTLYSTILVLVLVIDLEHRLILNVVMYPAWALALIGSFFFPEPSFYIRALVGFAVGFGFLWLVYQGGVLFVKLLSKRRGKDINAVAFGFGDVRLGGFMGLVLGFPDVLSAIIVAILLGGLFSLVYIVVQGLILRRYSMFTAVAYGPFLIIATVIYMFLL
jgi:leader peptidase (prepilin peptidase)/N-methyltransferase